MRTDEQRKWKAAAVTRRGTHSRSSNKHRLCVAVLVRTIYSPQPCLPVHLKLSVVVYNDPCREAKPVVWVVDRTYQFLTLQLVEAVENGLPTHFRFLLTQVHDSQ